MYNIESKLKTFYNHHVMLEGERKKELFRFRNINIDRLKEGLEEYNSEKDTSYKVVETITQGSVAMSTIIQNESSDYDIDVAIVFEEDNLPEGTTSTKNIVKNALKKKSKQFKVEPEAKTNCVRISYEEGYHVDFAIYRRSKNIFGDFEYEHCGSEWRKRDPRSITKWFIESNREKEQKLRIVVRLLKMFCKSREAWVMPGGLVQSVLVNECFEDDNRIDSMFYQTIKLVCDRLANYKEVYNPTDKNQNLKLIKKDDDRLERLRERLTEHINKLNVLFKEDCSYKQAIEAWRDFFYHSYWQEQYDNAKNLNKSEILRLVKSNSENTFDESEEFIEHFFSVENKFQLTLECYVEQNGYRIDTLTNMLRQGKCLSPRKKLKIFIKSNTVPKPYDVYWKVKNRGVEAKKRNQIRGQIVKTNSETHTENTQFKGEHFVACYIVKNGICVAKAKIDVPIT
ncbi:nucleotidyltransferase [Staphylococcus casei]|uniref:nucleotide-binding domain-containing protein n=1 Tax=Staphylococcus casei TaxID=201828 RepID=UPI000CD1D380|nr:nucleotidyltransferase [Staphylococcus casei]PNZ56487.1 nucleotidyltransferase [Staphylococcus casei]WJE86455.1 nucleotidyltransferase [Staphylococcus casei]